ncbi:MDR family MFS transporter [Bacillus solimangrovi]|uniref:MFS transporter n=1 Tax=Bacillus solimangrovi TaxID=1305675 RepID=A0A1E5LFU1_9BACI|nr:MFS transporter [Bacillus solimangrovi]OEH92926.1 MFS transporter [Bacillus solimangrovi]
MKWRDWDRNLKIRLYGEALVNICFWAFFPFMAIYFSNEFGKGVAGVLLVLSQVAGVIANLIGGYSADKYGRKNMMLLSIFLQGGAFTLFALANSPWYQSPIVTFISFTIIGVSGAIYWPASQAMVADVVEEKDRSTVFAVFYTALNIAVVIGPILGSLFFFDYRFEFLVTAALVNITLGFVIMKYIRETMPEDSTSKQLKLSWHEAMKEQLRDYKVIMYDKVFFLFIIAGILVAQTFMQMDVLVAVYMTETFQDQVLVSFRDWSFLVDGERAFGLIIAENGLLVALFTVIVTRWMTKYPDRNVFIVSSLLYGVGILILGSNGHIWVLIGAMAIFTFAELMVVGLQQDFVSRLAPEQMRGKYFAAASLRFTIGRTMAPMFIPLTLLIGYQWTFIVLFLLTLLSAVLYARMFYLFDKKQNSSLMQAN